MISSVQNPRIKAVLKLEKAHERREQGLFVIEGVRELSLAVAGGYAIRELLVCEAMLNEQAQALVRKLSAPVESISGAVFEKLAYRGNSDGMIAVAVARQLNLADICLPDNPFVIVLEAVEKPGNLGAILRTADAAHADAVIVCDPQTDVFNPNTVRSSIGCVFTQQIAVCTSADACQWLLSNGLHIHAAELSAAEWYHDADFTTPSAVVMGAEADGLTDFWLQHAHNRIKIPMGGYIDSLNVSVSTAIITFEAMRQRGFVRSLNR
ncbi:MAG: RNA methyltransferase [Bacteroidales bacterium]|jgi:TrmH family RNA methyltransferase|nr:RNA methyltransferase [Bacteroidales bacterium]